MTKIYAGQLGYVEVWANPGFKLLKCRVLNYTHGQNERGAATDTLVELTASWGAYKRGEWLAVHRQDVFPRTENPLTRSGHVHKHVREYWSAVGTEDGVPVLIYT